MHRITCEYGRKQSELIISPLKKIDYTMLVIHFVYFWLHFIAFRLFAFLSFKTARFFFCWFALFNVKCLTPLFCIYFNKQLIFDCWCPITRPSNDIYTKLLYFICYLVIISLFALNWSQLLTFHFRFSSNATLMKLYILARLKSRFIVTNFMNFVLVILFGFFFLVYSFIAWENITNSQWKIIGNPGILFNN